MDATQTALRLRGSPAHTPPVCRVESKNPSEAAPRGFWFQPGLLRCAGAFLWPVHISSWSIRYGIGLESTRCRSDPRGDSISRWAPGDRGYYKQQQLKHQLQAPSRCSTTCVRETKKRPGNMHEHRSVLS